jgi:aminobenzoyl-glutamate transport protein
MNTSSQNAAHQPRGFFDRFLNLVEKVGNLLPNPTMLFFWLCVLVVAISAAGAFLGWSMGDPRGEGSLGRAADGIVRAKSLLSEEGLRWIITSLVKNFVNFAPLGTVLVALLGVGLAEHSGLISAAIRLLILRAPKNLVTMALVFAGVNSNIASEIGYVVIVPMGAAIYYSLRRHPLAGLAAAFAGVSGGYSANLLLGTVDPLLAGLTEKAAATIDPAYRVNAACNFYFLFASTFLITIVGTWVSLYIVEPRLGEYSADNASGELNQQHMNELTRAEKRGLIAAGLVSLAMAALMVYMCVTPAQWSALAARWTGSAGSQIKNLEAEASSPEAGLSPVAEKIAEVKDSGTGTAYPYMGALATPAPQKDHPAFLDGVVALVFIGFLIPGIIYGVVAGTIKSDNDVIKSMSKSMSSMGSYIVLVFFAAQFVEFFNWTNLGLMLAIQGADFIRWLKLDNPLIFVFFILLSTTLNLLMGSASAKWGFMAPVFIPMLMGIGYSPELTQLAYRIGDSCTNVISPMMSYFGMIYVFASNYDKNFKLGTLMSLMMPYSMIFLVCWTAFFYIWVFVFGFPIGPNIPVSYPAQ